jgi:hypothetical protein
MSSTATALFARVGVDLAPSGACDCGVIVPTDGLGHINTTAARNHFMVCAHVDANMLEAQAGIDVSAIEAELDREASA